MNMPKLRFKGFNDEWEKKTLSYMLDNGIIMEHIDGNHGELYPRSEEFIDIGIPYISANSLVNGNIDYSKVKYLTLERAKQFKKGICKPGDLLFAHNATVGPVGIVGNSYPLSIISTTLTLYRINQEFLNDWFIKVYMESSAFIKQYSNVMKQSTRNQVPITMQRNFYFPYIKLEEQKKISSFYQLIDKKIQLQQEKIDLLINHKKGLMEKIFSQELRFKDNGQDFPKWTTNILTHFALINPKSEELSNEFRYIDLEAVVDGELFTTQVISKQNAPSRAQRVVEKGDILYQTVRPYQKNNLLYNHDFNEQVVASTGYAQIKVKENTDAAFLYQLMNTEKFTYYVLQRCTGTSYPAINSSDLGEIEVEMPVLKEQKKIASFLSNVDEKIANERKKLKALQLQKQAFMQQMFI